MNNKVFDLIVDKNYSTDKISRIHWTFMHGQLEVDNDKDIFYIKGDVVPDTEGIFKMIFNNKECSLFLWYSDLINGLHGLVVYNDDEEAYNYAKTCYTSKQSCI